MTEDQLTLLRDKFVLWDRVARKGPLHSRNYNRRAADALKALLAEQVEYGQSRPLPSREVIARIVDPDAFHRKETWVGIKPMVDKAVAHALAIADAILAAGREG